MRQSALYSWQQAPCTWSATHGQTAQCTGQVQWWQECWHTLQWDTTTSLWSQDRAAEPARNSVRSYLGLCVALPISILCPAIHHPTVQRADHVWRKRENLNTDIQNYCVKNYQVPTLDFAFLLLLRNDSIARNWGEKQHCWHNKPKHKID